MVRCLSVLGETVRQKVITNSKRSSASFKRKKRAVPASITLKHFFRKTEKPIDPNSDVGKEDGKEILSDGKEIH